MEVIFFGVPAAGIQEPIVPAERRQRGRHGSSPQSPTQKPRAKCLTTPLASRAACRVSDSPRVSGKYLNNGYWTKNPSANLDLDISHWVWRNSRPYRKRLIKGDPGWIDVPKSWRCVRNPNFKGHFRSERGGSCSAGYFLQLSYVPTGAPPP